MDRIKIARTLLKLAKQLISGQIKGDNVDTVIRSIRKEIKAFTQVSLPVVTGSRVRDGKALFIGYPSRDDASEANRYLNKLVANYKGRIAIKVGAVVMGRSRKAPFEFLVTVKEE